MPPFITSVKLTNFRSIASCSVRLGSLNILVGRNGTGKSNFLDALAFLRDSLRSSLDHAVRYRGGITAVRRRSGKRPAHFGIEVRFRLLSGSNGKYGFRIKAVEGGRYAVHPRPARRRRREPARGVPDRPAAQLLRRRGRGSERNAAGAPAGQR